MRTRAKVVLGLNVRVGDRGEILIWRDELLSESPALSLGEERSCM